MTYKIPDWLKERRAAREGRHVFVEPSRNWDDQDMHDVLTRDVAFNRHSMNDGHHISPYDNNTVQVGTDGIEVALAQGIDEENFKRILSAATRSTIGIEIMPRWEFCGLVNHETDCEWPDLEHEWRDGTPMEGDHGWYHKVDPLEPEQDWEEMLKGGLQTALETQTIVFAVRGASRTCTHQLVRSRRAAFHQQSQRASYMGDMPEFRMPESVWRNTAVRDLWIKSLLTSWRAYRVACEHDISYQDARFILPEGTTNFIMLEYPVREFLNVFAYRACHMFQWEIAKVMHLCRDALLTAHPWMEPYVKITCEKTGVCEFQGWERVEGQCTLPMAREDNRRFKPVHHRIG